MRKRKLDARGLLIDAANQIEDGADFEGARQHLLGNFLGLPPYITASLNLYAHLPQMDPRYGFDITDISHNGWHAMIMHRANDADAQNLIQSRVWSWHPRHGLKSLSRGWVRVSLINPQFPPGSDTLAWFSKTKNGHVELHWGDYSVDLGIKEGLGLKVHFSPRHEDGTHCVVVVPKNGQVIILTKVTPEAIYDSDAYWGINKYTYPEDDPSNGHVGWGRFHNGWPVFITTVLSDGDRVGYHVDWHVKGEIVHRTFTTTNPGLGIGLVDGKLRYPATTLPDGKTKVTHVVHGDEVFRPVLPRDAQVHASNGRIFCHDLAKNTLIELPNSDEIGEAPLVLPLERKDVGQIDRIIAFHDRVYVKVRLKHSAEDDYRYYFSGMLRGESTQGMWFQYPDDPNGSCYDMRQFGDEVVFLRSTGRYDGFSYWDRTHVYQAGRGLDRIDELMPSYTQSMTSDRLYPVKGGIASWFIKNNTLYTVFYPTPA